MFTQKSYVLKSGDVSGKWHLIDAKDKVLGRLATEIVEILRGKKNPKYTPNMDSGDSVVVVNASEIKLTGNKLDKKVYYWHTNYVGGLKQRTAKEQMERGPEKILMSAVKGMLPKNVLGRKQLKKLRVFSGENHDHSAQKPVEYEVK